MALILCIETTSTNCSVALGKAGNLLHLVEDNTKSYSHAEKLHVFINEVLEETQTPLSKLDAIAVSKGPGSYTGLRIGVSASKGLSFSLDKPLISIETLTSLASQIQHSEGMVIPMLDARRMEVYSAIFTSEGEQIRETQAQLLDERSFSEELELGVVSFIGDGVEKFKNICTHENARFIESLPSAKEMVKLAETNYKSHTFEDVAYFEPFYLKDFVAGK